MATDWFSGREIATAMGLLVMTWPLGIAAGQIGHTWLAQISHWSTPFYVASFLFGLIGAAPAGIIMALASEAIEPQNRAFGMSVFFSLYFVLVAPAPVVAGWLVDNSGSAWAAIVFTAILFAATGASYKAFRLTQRMIAK